MNLPQENFDRAVEAGQDTFAALTGGAPTLKDQAPQRLEGWMWDLEAVVAALRTELANRDDVNPIDLG